VANPSQIELDTSAEVPGIDDPTFQNLAADAMQNCPVSKALAGTKIGLKATLGQLSGAGRGPSGLRSQVE